MTKRERRLREWAQEHLDKILAGVPVQGQVELRWRKMDDSNGEVDYDPKTNRLFIYVNSDLCRPTENTCRQALGEVLVHEVAHVLDWNAMNSVQARKHHDEHWGIEYARAFRARVKE